MGWTIARFAHYASSRLHPLGVRVSVDVFGLSATHDLGIGQVPGRLAKYVDAVYPMVYPSHYNSGEFNLPDPSAAPGQTVALSLRDFRNAMLGRKAQLIPWLEDFSLTSAHPALADVEAQIDAARRFAGKGLPPLEPGGRLHGASPQVVSGRKRLALEAPQVTQTYDELKDRLATIHDLRMARRDPGLGPAHEDAAEGQRSCGPSSSARCDRFSHELFIDDEIGRLLDELSDYEESAGYDSDEASLIRIARRDYEKAKRVPRELRAEMTRAGANALPAWIEAREKSDFSIFLPYLKKNVELTHRYVDCFEGMGFESAYDVAAGRLRRGPERRRGA